jgi:RNA polymerase sigma factor (TIGR02999 family)
MSTPQPEPLTVLLARWNADQPGAGDAVLARVYDELRRLAGGYLRDSGAQVTLQPTALVNEALMKLLGGPVDWDSRAHFFGAAARAMRQVLVDAARRRLADKRGGGAVHLTLGVAESQSPVEDAELVELVAALARLEALDAQQARIVELRYFTGLSIDETAAVLGLHPSAVNREWAMARAWLRRELRG